MHNIEFDIMSDENDDADIIFFNSLLNEELLLRNLPTYGSLTERRNRLLPYVKTEHRLSRIQDAILRTAEGKEAALMLIKQAIPCIMHMENRIGEKIITMLLAIGAKRFQRGSRSISLKNYIEHMERIVRTRILGTRLRPKQWKFPTSGDGKEVGQVKLSNKNTRKFIKNLTALVHAIFDKEEDEQDRDAWSCVITNYDAAMEILRQQREYTDDDIDKFQDHVDNFFEEYIKILGVEGITNYIHMLGSGHVKYYMQEHRNLYKYSQQGWESLNAKFKQVFFNHTQRGGNSGKYSEESERSYLFSVMKAFQRELLWISGDAENYFRSVHN
jgi:hypothetical protein